MAVTLRVVADKAKDGPILLGPNPQADFNQAVSRAESALPEGAYVQVQIDSVNAASQVVASLNSAFQNGQIHYPGTGELIRGWPEYPGQIAFGWNGGTGVQLRYVKGQPWLAVLVVLIIAVAILVAISLESSAWRMQTPSSGQGGGGVGLKSGSFIWFGIGPRGTFRIVGLPWYWVAGGMALAAVGAVAARVYGEAELGEASVLRGYENVEQAREGL